MYDMFAETLLHQFSLRIIFWRYIKCISELGFAQIKDRLYFLSSVL